MSFGSMNDGGGNDSPMAEINVTPLVDVMLVLLIVFMVTMPVLTHQIPLNLPTASENAKEQVQESKEPFRMDIRVDGTYFVDGQEITSDKLAQALKVQLEKDPDTVLAIAADKASEHAALTALLAAAQEVGLTKVGFVTETPAVLKAQ